MCTMSVLMLMPDGIYAVTMLDAVMMTLMTPPMDCVCMRAITAASVDDTMTLNL